MRISDDNAVESHFDYLFNLSYNQQEPCCDLCRYFDGTNCEIPTDTISEDETDFIDTKRDKDDYCDDFSMKEPNYPPWADF